MRSLILDDAASAIPMGDLNESALPDPLPRWSRSLIRYTEQGERQILQKSRDRGLHYGQPFNSRRSVTQRSMHGGSIKLGTPKSRKKRKTLMRSPLLLLAQKRPACGQHVMRPCSTLTASQSTFPTWMTVMWRTRPWWHGLTSAVMTRKARLDSSENSTHPEP